MQTSRQGQSSAPTLKKDGFPAGAGAAEAAAAPEDADIQTGTIVRFDFSEDAESEDLGALKFGTVREAFGGKNAGCRFTQYFTVSHALPGGQGQGVQACLLGACELCVTGGKISARQEAGCRFTQYSRVSSSWQCLDFTSGTALLVPVQSWL